MSTGTVTHVNRETDCAICRNSSHLSSKQFAMSCSLRHLTRAADWIHVRNFLFPDLLLASELGSGESMICQETS